MKGNEKACNHAYFGLSSLKESSVFCGARISASTKKKLRLAMAALMVCSAGILNVHEVVGASYESTVDYSWIALYTDSFRSDLVINKTGTRTYYSGTYDYFSQEISTYGEYSTGHYKYSELEEMGDASGYRKVETYGSVNFGDGSSNSKYATEIDSDKSTSEDKSGYVNVSYDDHTGGRVVLGGNSVTTYYKSLYETAIGRESSTTNYGGTAVGGKASAGLYSTALGNEAGAGGENSVAVGYQTSASYSNSVAIGNGSSTSEQDSVSVGSTSIKRKIMYVANGVADSDATTFAQIKTDADGSYIKKSLTDSTTLNTEGTVGKNLTALDNAIGVVTVPTTASSSGRSLLTASTGKLYVLGESLNEDGTLKTSVSDNLIKLDQKIGEITSNYGILSNDNTISQNLMALEAAIAKANQTLDFSNPDGTAATNSTTTGVTNGSTTNGTTNGTTNSGTTTSSTTIYSNDGTPIAKIAQGTVSKNDTGFVSGGQVWNADMAAGQTISLSDATHTVNGKTIGANQIASNDGTVLATFQKMQKVSSTDTGFVSGSDLYNEVRPTDGTYVKKESTTGTNLKALDDAIINLDQKYESANMQQYNALTSDIRDVAAGAAALAALHPGTYDPTDKMSFAVGFGHYKDANAGALGAFYRPNADTLISFAGTVGNGDPMLNVGFSFKLGERGLPDRKYVENSDVARVIDAQDKRIVAQEKKIAALEADNQRIKAQMAEVIKKLELSDTVKKTAAKN